MLFEWLMQLMNKASVPESAASRKNPQMVKAKTEADILKAEQDIKKTKNRSAQKS